MQPETKFKLKLRPKIESLPKSNWVKIQQVSIRGVPDFLGCVNGKFVALELKKDSRAPISRLQLHFIKRVNKNGGFARVIYPENMNEVLEELWNFCYGAHLSPLLAGS